MPSQLSLDPAARARLAQLGFDPASLPTCSRYVCDLCECQVFRTIAHTDRYAFPVTYQMCEGCGLVFQNPHPTAEGYAEFYAKWYRRLVGALHNQPSDEQTLRADQDLYAAKVVRFLKRNIGPRPIQSSVDVGGSVGSVAKAVQDALGGRCLVVDPSATELAEARARGLEAEQGLAEAWEPGTRRFDLALVCRTVDHLLSVSHVLGKIAGCLKPGGYLFIDPVDFESCARTAMDYRQYLKMDHVYYLSDETMRLYLRAAGFEVVAADFGDGTYYMSYLARYTGEAQKPPRFTPYAREVGRMLRERLLQPAPQPYPVDLLTRVARAVRRGLGSGR